MPTATHLTSSYDNVDRNSYTTASVSPTASRWMVADVYTRQAPDAAVVTVSSTHSLAVAWTEELGEVSSDTDHRIARWYARTGASPGSSVITLDMGGVVQQGCAWIVYELSSDVDASDPFVQSVGADGSTNSVTIALAAFASGDNRPLICCFHRTEEGASPEAGYTEIGDVFGNSPLAGFAAAYHGSATDTSVTYSWTTAATPSIGIASEIKAAAGGGAANVFDLGWVM